MNQVVRLAAPIFALSIFAPVPAFAQGRQQPRLVFNALDLDHDGILSAAEIATASRSLLTLDRNGDGQLTFDEFSGRPDNATMDANAYVQQLMVFDKAGKGFLVTTDLPERMQGIFARGDSDHDGKLTPAEIRSLSAKMGMPQGPRATSTGKPEGMFRQDPVMAALDTNHDGIIDATEILNAPAALLTLDSNHDGRLTPDETAVKQPTPEDRVEHMFGEWDTNHDGKLAKDEFPDGLQPQFSSIDTNHDGFVDRQEMLAYYKAHPQGTRGPSGAPNAQGGDRPHNDQH